MERASDAQMDVQAGMQVAVVGGGPAGLMTAIALTAAGLDTVLIARPATFDHRTTALFADSVTALRMLGVWDACAQHAAALKTLRIVDDTGRLVRAPETCFEAAEIGLDAFGYNIENRHLIAALQQRAGNIPLRRIEDDVVGLRIADDHVDLDLKSGAVCSAALVVGADGHQSLCRSAAGITMTQTDYPQVALTFNIQHTRKHRNISTEFHTPSGPFTAVPLPGLRSSIVCVVSPAEGDLLRASDETALAEEIERRLHSILGKVTLEPGRGFFPLAMGTAEVFGRSRIALVGEAAHRIPPIGAQGLNLSLRDGATIAELAAQARHDSEDIGGDALLARYETMRRADVTSRTFAVDILNRSLLSSFLPLQGVRGLAMHLLNTIGPLRRAVMREGIAPAAAQPRLMRGEDLLSA